VRTLVDARLRDEARQYAFRFACEDCVHFASSPTPPVGHCSLGYPATPRREALQQRDLELCKTFELA